jgi:hypothetical protein
MSARELLTSAGLHESHWGRRIIAAEDGGFTGREKEDAFSWVTCACGKLDPRIPRYGSKVPKDQTLTILGSQFYKAVDRDQPLRAAETLIDIEKRAAEILAGMEGS